MDEFRPPEEYRRLPRWVKAYLAVRIARRAVDTLDARTLPSDFRKVLSTLEEVERAVETGVEIQWTGRPFPFSAARRYADRRRSHGPEAPIDAIAALAVDDAYGLVTRVAREGRDFRRKSADDFQVRKLVFARNCALRVAAHSKVDAQLAVAFQRDLDRLVRAVESSGPWTDARPVARDFLAQFAEFDTGEPLDPRTAIDLVPLITYELIQRLHSEPRLLYRLPPRRFEELIATVFERFGFCVELTAPVKDGGRDVIAVKHHPTKLRYLIECKRYAPDNKVGLEIVQRLHGVLCGEPATAGILATTSTFTRSARDFLARPMVEYRLSGKDFEAIRNWLADLEQIQRISAVVGPHFSVTPSGLVIPEDQREQLPNIALHPTGAA